MSRQARYAEAFSTQFRLLKQKFGSGPVYMGTPRSWAEGMTRRAARKIARKLARAVR